MSFGVGGFVVAWILSEIINAGKFWLNPLLSEFGPVLHNGGNNPG